MTKKQKIKKLIIILILILIGGVISIFASKINSFTYSKLLNKYSIVSKHNSLVIHFVNVGDADAIAIELPDEKLAIIDTGWERTNVNFTTYLDEKVMNNRRSSDVDYLILSHADADHIGGAIRLIQNYNVKKIYMPIVPSDTLIYDRLTASVENSSAEICALNIGDKIDEKEYCFNFFYLPNMTDTNDSSTVVRLDCFDKRFLFAGDISSSAESLLVDSFSDELNADVLKVPHHGSKYSSSLKFVFAVSPDISIITCDGNGHPTDEALNNLNMIESRIYRTDLDGDITLLIGKNYPHLSVLIGEITYIGIPFDVRIFIVFIDVLLLVDVIIIVSKREKRDKHVKKLEKSS